MKKDDEESIKFELQKDKLPPKKGLVHRDEEEEVKENKLFLPIGVKLAPYWQRGGAFVIDIVYGYLLFLIPYHVTSYLEKYYLLVLEKIKIDQVLSPEQLHDYLHLGAGLCLFILFYIVPVIRKKRTFGKYCFGLWVGDTYGELISGTRAFFRELLKIVSVLSLVGVLIIFFSLRRQGIHDYFFRTIVYK